MCYAVSHLLLNVDLRSAVTTLSAASAERDTENAVQHDFSGEISVHLIPSQLITITDYHRVSRLEGNWV